MTKKDMFFFKKTCKYCQEVFNIISQSNLFVLIDVDKMSDRLPGFVRQVPLIFTNERKIIIGDSVMSYAKNTMHSIRKHSQQNSHQNPQQNNSQLNNSQQDNSQEKIQNQRQHQESPSSYTFDSQNFEMIRPNESPGMEFGGNKFDFITSDTQHVAESSQRPPGRAPKISPDALEAFLAQRRAETPVSGNMR